MSVGTTVDSGRPVRLLGLLSPLGLVRSLWANRELVRTLTAREVSGRYRGSALGGLWSFIQPLCMLAIYTFVFSVVLPAKWGADVTTSTGAFARTLFAGLILYSVFSETLAGSASVVIANPSYVKRVVFPLELLPMTKLGAALVHLFIGLGMLLVATVATTHSLPMTVVYFPLVLLPLVMLAAGLGWLVASLSVYLRDLAQVLTVVLNVLVLLTPIFYPPSAVPTRFRFFIELNPLTSIVESGRRVLLWGQAPDWSQLAVVTVLGAVVMQLGFAWFVATKKGFADVL